MTDSDCADYIIVGAGSAGCALAYRLGVAGCDVLVVECGGGDVSPLIRMPAALSYPMNMKKYDWGFRAAAEESLGGRRLACPRGKVIGGSSSINGMVYVRGNRGDFDHWQQCGAQGWGYDDVLPYFIKMETATHGGKLRGKKGPLFITRPAAKNPLYGAFLAAGAEAGFGFSEDYNGEQQEGFCRLEQTVRGGERWSAARAYLQPALRFDNVNIIRARARKVLFDGDKATGIEVRQNNTIRKLHARREVVVCASAINSPTLLMHSGIGEHSQLRRFDIKTIADRRGVGGNLQDHLELYIQQRCRKPITLNRKLGLFAKARIGAQWLFLRNGDGATNHFETGAFLRSPDAAYADIQYHFLPAAIRYDGKAPVSGDGFQAHVGPMRPLSRGRVSLVSADCEAPPHICFNYMSTEKDWRDFRHCIRLTRDLFARPAFGEFGGGEIAPGAHCQSDDELNNFIRDNAESAYHPCGTCKMGAEDDKDAVVDSSCCVIGARGLRVVDSSVFPRITYGNINAPSIMTGEKAADHILGILPNK
ncbi:MAG: choline dehydrogenase [Gammaproteobacteria bacterium]